MFDVYEYASVIMPCYLFIPIQQVTSLCKTCNNSPIMIVDFLYIAWGPNLSGILDTWILPESVQSVWVDLCFHSISRSPSICSIYVDNLTQNLC